MNREHRGRQFWLKVFNHLKTREVADILIAVTDDLKGIGEALATVFPAIALQTCIAHLTRSNLDLASREGRKLLATASESIHTVPSAGATAVELDPFKPGPWNCKFPIAVTTWRRSSDRIASLFAFTPPTRQVIYTTSAIGNINVRLRKTIKIRDHFPSDDAAVRLIWLALHNIAANLARAARAWREAMAQFAAPTATDSSVPPCSMGPTCSLRRSFATSDARHCRQVYAVFFADKSLDNLCVID